MSRLRRLRGLAPHPGLVVVLGYLLIAAGVAAAWPPAGLVVAGALLVSIGREA